MCAASAPWWNINKPMPKTLELPPQERKLDEPEEKVSDDLTPREPINKGPEKRNAVGIYLEGIEKREESIYRLGDNNEFTDPDGIDVVKLLPGNIKQVLFGDFIEQKLEEADRFKSKYEYKGLPTRYSFPNNQRREFEWKVVDGSVIS